MPRPRILAALSVLLLCMAGAARADMVTDWNSIWLDCVRATGGPPCPIARAGAMVHAAIYDAVNSIDGTHEPYLVRIPNPSFASPEAAAAVAAHDVLVYLYPQREAILDQALTASLDHISNTPAKRTAVGIGHRVAHAVIEARRNDGSDDATPYPVGTLPGEWRPTAPDYSNPATPNWGAVRPWTMIRGDQFRPVGPLGISDRTSLLQSPGYASILEDVRQYGERNGAVRTPYQTETAFFWANDVNGTYKPPGQLNSIAQVLARQQHLTLAQSARLFALLNIGLADAGIVAWDCKYLTPLDFWRPITGIREADTDGNPLTQSDPSWEPLNAFTPPFPAYISGHATFAGTAAAVFQDFFGTDAITHTFGTDDPLYTGGPRTYHSFSEAAIENARSRIYLGVHWQFDADDGVAAGSALGHFVYGSILRPAAVPFADRALVMERPGGSQMAAEYELAAPGPVRIVVMDVQGRRLATLVDGFQTSGRHTVVWDGRDEGGAFQASGVYFARVQGQGIAGTRKLLVVH